MVGKPWERPGDKFGTSQGHPGHLGRCMWKLTFKGHNVRGTDGTDDGTDGTCLETSLPVLSVKALPEIRIFASSDGFSHFPSQGGGLQVSSHIRRMFAAIFLHDLCKIWFIAKPFREPWGAER